MNGGNFDCLLVSHEREDNCGQLGKAEGDAGSGSDEVLNNRNGGDSADGDQGQVTCFLLLCWGVVIFLQASLPPLLQCG